MYRIHQSSRALPHGVQRLTGVRTAVVSSLSSSPPAESVLRSRRFHRVRRSNSHQQQDRQLHTQAASSASSSTYMDLFGVQRSSHFSARPPDRDSTQHDKEGQEQQQREDVEEDELNHDIDTSVVLHDLSRVFAGLSLVLQQTAALTVSRARDSTAQVQQTVQTNGRGLEQVVRGVAASTLGVGSKALPSLPSRLSDAHGFASRVVDVVGEQMQRGVSGKDGVKMGTIDPAEVQRKVERTMNQFSKEASAIQRSLKSALDGTLEKRPELRGVVEEVGKHVNKAGEEVNKIMRRAQQQNGQQGSEEGFSTRDHASTAGMIRRTDSQTSEVNERIANTAAQDYDNDSSGNPTPLSPKMAASAAAEALARQESAARSDRPTSSESLPPPLSAAELAAAKRATTLAGVSRTSTFTTSKPPSQTAPTPAASSPSASAHQSTKSITPPAPGVAATPVIPFVVARDTSASNVKSASAPENAQFASNSTNDGTKSATSEAALPPASSSNSSSSASSPPKAGSAPSSGNNFSHSSFSDSFRPRERTVPSSPLARIAGFSQIASSIVLGTIKDKITGAFSGAPAGGNTKEEEQAAQRQQSGTQPGASAANGGQSSTASPNAGSKTVMGSFLSEANTERLAEGLCRMRGAALKVGQMLSIADDSMVPPQLQAVLDRVRDGADVMPRHQLERALYTELGPNWQDQLSEFDWQPMAAASIGQVHRARLKSNGMEVVMKVQCKFFCQIACMRFSSSSMCC